MSPIVAHLEGAAVGLVVALGSVGVALALGASGFATVVHARAGDLLVAVSLLLSVGSYASGVHRASPARWFAHGAFLVGAPGLLILGSAAASDASGAAGRAHVAIVVGGAVSAASIRLVHVSLGVGLLAIGVAMGARQVRAGLGAALRFAAAASAASAVAVVLALVVPAPARVPDVGESLAVSPPWPALALAPIETMLGLRMAMVLVVVAMLVFMSLPFVDRESRPSWVRHATSALLGVALAILLALLALGSLSAEGVAGHSWW